MTDEYGPGGEDYEYDEARQRMLDALNEGEEAGKLGLAADLCPYIPSEPEYNQWHRGRLRMLVQQQRRNAA